MTDGPRGENTVLDVRDLNVTYPDGTAGLKQVDFSLTGGSCLSVVGESGSGKSTLLGALLGLLPRGTAVRGSIRVDGVEQVGMSADRVRGMRQRKMGYVPQDPFASVDPLRPVLHHIRFAGNVAGLRIDDRIAVERLAKFGIAPEISQTRRWPHQWSGGMLQRACIAAATVADPLLVLADEPTSALDPETARSVLRELRSGTGSLVLVTHDLRTTALVSDHIAVLLRGIIVEQGLTAQVLKAPKHPYTAALLDAARKTGALDP